MSYMFTKELQGWHECIDFLSMILEKTVLWYSLLARDIPTKISLGWNKVSWYHSKPKSAIFNICRQLTQQLLPADVN